MDSGCLPCDALSQHLPSYLGFTYPGRGLSLYGCCSKAQLPLLTLDEGYLLVTDMRSTREGNGKPLQYSCRENPMNSMKRENDRILKEELPRSVGA